VRGEPCPKPTRSTRTYKKRAYDQEKRLERQLVEAGMPAKRLYASGAAKGIGQDGDVSAEWFLAECKSYTPVISSGEKSLRLPIEWLDKIIREAALHGKPGLVVMQPKGSQRAFVVCDRDQFVGLMGRAYRALRGEDF
jgi:hypothetical protein